ncbi:MAG: 4-hydroxybenzoate--CoA ligase [Acidobacteria bacterium RIFCSPLOWO2_02_FULL_65_29]|nr:MAG: 4-hydroxybenzoate--CoA ligase [Acidobacteria bacterium RIFCSPLOWO2_02_FULL_65_29]
MTTAAALGVPEIFNAAAHFVDRHLREGRAGKVAIECGDEAVTYAQLHERVNRFGSALRARCGVGAGARVALMLVDGPAFAYGFFGSIKIGAVPIPTNTLWKAADYEYLLNDSAARVLVISEELIPELSRIPRDRLRALEHVVVVGRPTLPGSMAFERFLAEGSPDLEPAPTGRDAPAFWLYSSGSTGTPKGCVHLQHDMVVSAELFAKGVLGIRESDRCFSVAKLFFAYGLGNALYFPLAVGATSILWGGPPTPSNVYRVIERHRPTIFYSVPTGYGMLLAHRSDHDLSSIRVAVSAGEALPPALYERFKRRFGIEVLDGIGSTEALQTFISNRPGAIRPGSSGRLVPGYDARILDDRGTPVATGDIGHLWVAGDSTCAGYWNQPGKSAATIVDGWLRTGDKYSQDGDGYFWYAGRTDDMLKVGGLWVSPVEIENVLVEHPAVRECGVVGREDHDTLVKPAAYIVLRERDAASPDLAAELQRFVRERLADYKRPRWVEFVADLPKTPTGKVQRFKLRS